MPCSACAVSIGRICAVCVLLLFVLLCFGGCEDTAAVGWVSDAAVTEAVPIDRDYTDTDAPLVSEIVTETAAITAVVQTTAEQTVTATETETEIQAPPAETVVPQPQRITIPRLSTRPIGEAEQILQDAGISYTVKEEYSLDFAARTVMNVHFYGTLDDDGCHINPAYPVEVTVSLGTRRKTCVKAVDEKRIYLTFDDGPFKYTRQVLDKLEQYGVRATFFTLGRYAAVYPDLIRAIDEGGHLLACHSYSHDYMSLYASAETVLGEIRSWEKTIEAAGVTLPEKIYFRFPGGTTTE